MIVSKAITVAALALAACIFCGTSAKAESSLEQGIVQYRTENFEEAMALLKKARAEQPESSIAAFYLGMAYKQAGDLAGATKHLTDAATLKPPVLDAYLELADVHHTAGNEAKALEWVRRAEKAEVTPAKTAYLKGVVLAALGESRGALRAFEKAKKLDKTLTQSADFQMAIVMATSREFVRARDALRAVVAADPKSDIASYAKEYEKSFTNIIESYRTWHLTLGANYLYDDNAISSPSNPTAQALIGNPTGQRDNAFLGTLRVDYTPMISGSALFSAQYMLQTTKYGNDDNPSTLVNSLTLIPGYVFGTSALSLPVNYSHVLLKEEKYQQMLSARPTWSWQINPQNILQGGLSYSRREMLTLPLAAEENRDGNLFGASVGQIFSYGTQGGMAAARYEYTWDAAEGSNWANRGHKVSLNGSVPLAAALKLNLSGEVTQQDYLSQNASFGFIKRDDTTWFATTGLSWDVRPNIVLSAQYAHTTVDSNIAVYGYSRNTFSTGVEVAF